MQTASAICIAIALLPITACAFHQDDVPPESATAESTEVAVADELDDPSEATIEAEAPDDPSDLDGRATFELTLCVNLALDKIAVREAFCRSLPTKAERNACWRHRFDSAIGWINWCVGEFDA